LKKNSPRKKKFPQEKKIPSGKKKESKTEKKMSLSLDESLFESRSLFLRMNNWFSLRIVKELVAEDDANTMWKVFEKAGRDIALFYFSLPEHNKQKILTYDNSVREIRDLVPHKGPPLSIEDIELTRGFWERLETFDEDLCKELFPGEDEYDWLHIWNKWKRFEGRTSDFSFSLDVRNFKILVDWYKKQETTNKKRKRNN
jgi:hypothetical protein